MATKWRENNLAHSVGFRPFFTGNQIELQGGAGGVSTTIYTTPAGKTFYLFDFTLVITTVGSGLITIGHYASGGAVIRLYAGIDCSGAGAEVSPCFGSFFVPIEIAAGEMIKVVSSAAGLVGVGGIHGIEE